MAACNGDSEKSDLFCNTAARFYRLESVTLCPGGRLNRT